MYGTTEGGVGGIVCATREPCACGRTPWRHNKRLGQPFRAIPHLAWLSFCGDSKITGQIQ